MSVLFSVLLARWNWLPSGGVLPHPPNPPWLRACSCNVTFGRLTELRIVPEGKGTSEPVVVVAFNRLAILLVWPVQGSLLLKIASGFV